MGVVTSAIIAGTAMAAQTAGAGIAAAGGALASGAAAAGLTTTTAGVTSLSGLGQAAAAGVVSAGTAIASEKMAGKPPSAGELANKASKRAEKKRLAFSASKAEKGKTKFASAMPGIGGAGGQPLKETLG
jgi:hypothetical protein